MVSFVNSIDGIGGEISDTATVSISTYQFSPLPTSGTAMMLVGGIDESELGKLSVKSYFRVGNSAISSIASSIPSDAVFDSLSLELPYSSYYYGDTTLHQAISLHRVAQEMELVEVSSAWEDDEIPVFVGGSALYSNNNFDYDPTPLGSTAFYPKPNSYADTLKIKVGGSLGVDLWEMILAYDSKISNSEEFLEYLKGFVLVPSSDAKSITGFYTDSLSLNIHYSYTRTDGMRTHSFISMKVDNSTYQFNSIATDRQHSNVSSLVAGTESELVSSETDNKAYIQGLTGIVTKIRFPYMHEMMNRDDLTLNKAELIIESANTNQDQYPSPSSLVLLVGNDYGVPAALLPLSYESGTQAAYLQKAYATGTGNNKYTFNLTEYISNYRKAINNSKKVLYLSIPVSDLSSTANRLVIAAGENKPLVTLRLIYTKH